MTMFSAEKRRFCGGYGGGGYGGEGFVVMSGYGDSSIGSDLVVAMAEDDLLRSDSLNEGGAESSSKDERDEEWLQLGLGGGGGGGGQPPKNNGGSGLVELELMPTTSTSTSTNTHTRPLLPEFRPPRPPLANLGGFGPSFFLQHPSTVNPNFSPHQEINWGFRPIPINVAAPSSSSSSFSSPYFPRPFQLYAGVEMVAPPAAAAVDFRVIQPPRRPHSGIWFALQASQNQEREPFLPQISKSYLRIKDGRMTIRLVIKYLVSKLSLENESEIEIRCKGQRLLPFLTLQHVRDSIWSSPRDFITLLPNSSTTHHIMVLHYARNPSL